MLTLQSFQVFDCVPTYSLFEVIITSQMAVSEVVVIANIMVVFIYGSGFSTSNISNH